MHELSVTQRILEISLDRAKEAAAKRVTDIYLVIGQLSSIVKEGAICRRCGREIHNWTYLKINGKMILY